MGYEVVGERKCILLCFRGELKAQKILNLKCNSGTVLPGADREASLLGSRGTYRGRNSRNRFGSDTMLVQEVTRQNER